ARLRPSFIEKRHRPSAVQSAFIFASDNFCRSEALYLIRPRSWPHGCPVSRQLLSHFGRDRLTSEPRGALCRVCSSFTHDCRAHQQENEWEQAGHHGFHLLSFNAFGVSNVTGGGQQRTARRSAASEQNVKRKRHEKQRQREQKNNEPS